MKVRAKTDVFKLWVKLTCLLLLILLIVGCSSQENDGKAEEKHINATERQKVVVKELVSQKMVEPISYQGVLEPAKIYQLSLRTGGVIAQLLVERGQVVEQGQVLAVLDTQQLAMAVERAVTRVEQAEVQLAQVVAGPREEEIAQMQARLSKVELLLQEQKQAYQRAEQLYANEAISRVMLEREESQYLLAQQDLLEAQKQVELLAGTPSAEDVATTELNLTQAKIDLAEAQLMLKESSLLAPEKGVVLDRLVSEGQMIGAGQGIYPLGVIDPLHITLEIPVQESSQWQPGAQVTIEYRDDQRPGKVLRQASGQTGGTGMLETVIALANPNQDWLAGEMVTVTGAGSEMTGHFIPEEAVLYHGEPHVAVVDEHDQVHYHQVELGLPFGQEIQIFGLQEGTLVVIEGAVGLQDGQLVAPARGN